MRLLTPIKSGFTLLELSIALVIIGLISGGILLGRELIHIAELHAQIKQFNEYQVAYNVFRNKYNCIAGDCAKAGDFFPGAVNGNGNGLIENSYGTTYEVMPYAPWDQSYEMQYFFIELSQAGLIGGHFDGTANIGGGLPVIKLNSTATFFAGDSANYDFGPVFNVVLARKPWIVKYRKGDNAMWFVACLFTKDPATGLISPRDDNRIAYWDNVCGTFTASDLKFIDDKIDDGRPLGGKIIGFGGAISSRECLTNITLNGTGDAWVYNESDVNYNVTFKGPPQCQAVIPFM